MEGHIENGEVKGLTPELKRHIFRYGTLQEVMRLLQQDQRVRGMWNARMPIDDLRCEILIKICIV